MSEPTFDELFEIPERVHAGEFVLNLTDGVSAIERTLDQYVVTDNLKECFSNALSLIKNAVTDNKSKAAFLHGSFGSGKSHFMAVLHAILDNHPAARSRDDLAHIFADSSNDAALGKNYLMVPLHMIGAVNLETAILSGYSKTIRKLHPDAPIPGVYIGNHILEDAEQLRSKLGDDKFFSSINEGQSNDDDDFGDFGSGWNITNYQDALAQEPGEPERSRLIGDLIRTLMSRYDSVAHAFHGEEGEAFLDLDKGMSIISDHAKELGYDAIILFLDEMVLWLASHAANIAFVHQEGQKSSKFVDFENPRSIPIISFVARQRDLSDLIGEHVVGAERTVAKDAFQHWEGRFAQIQFEDRDLVEIVEKRILKPKTAEAKQRLSAAFDRAKPKNQSDLTALIGSESTPEEFRRVYPFSPALVKTVVELSGILQRERTALRLLMQLLVDHRNDSVGHLIPVADLWQYVHKGEDSSFGGLAPIFKQAQRLYSQSLKPLMAQRASLNPESLESAKGTKEYASFLQEDRIVRTLLIGALIPQSSTFRDITPARLAALNHGTIKVLIPGGESKKILGMLRDLSVQVGQIRLTTGSDPRVSIHLAEVDTERLLRRAESADNRGTRIKKIRELFLTTLDLEISDQLERQVTLPWRGSQRELQLIFANIRELADESFKPFAENWKLIVDWPFDDEGHTPEEDVDRLAKFRESHGDTKTLAWVPTFFTQRTQGDLAKLIRIEWLLKPGNLERNSEDLSSEDQASARSILENQKSGLTSKILDALSLAYGVEQRENQELVTNELEVGDRFQSLQGGLHLSPPTTGYLGLDAIQQLLDQALSFEFPDHPKFPRQTITKSDLRKILKVFREAISDDLKRTQVDRSQREMVRQIVEPLQLGTLSEAHFVPSSFWPTHFRRNLSEMGVENDSEVSVADLRKIMNLPKPRGLLREVQDLVIICFAEQENRTFHLHGGKVESIDIDKLRDDYTLRAEPMPDPETWARAIKLGQEIFGIPPKNALTLVNVQDFVSSLKTKIDERREAAEGVLASLNGAQERLGFNTDCRRISTANDVCRLLRTTAGDTPASIIASIANAQLSSQPLIIARSLSSSLDLDRKLKSVQWDYLSSLISLAENNGEARSALEHLIESFEANEYDRPLGPAIDQANTTCAALIGRSYGKPPEAPTPPKSPNSGPKSFQTERVTRQNIDHVVESLTNKIRESIPDTDKSYRLNWYIEEDK